MTQRSARDGRGVQAPGGWCGALGVAAVVAALSSGCGPELDYGSWSAALSGEATSFGGTTTAWSGTVGMDISYNKSRGSLSYEIDVCEGLVDYYSSTPCFARISVLDTTDGLVGLEDQSWQHSFVEGSGTLLCQGTESISIAGEIKSRDEADLQLTYHLDLDSASSSGCVAALEGATVRVSAAGTLSLEE